MQKKVSLIITTYNRVTALELVLLSVLQQYELPDETIIADDGSTEETQWLCRNYAKKMPLIYCWQADEGFRVATIRNKALACAHNPYIILIDGDMVLHPAFIADHKYMAHPLTFVQGKRVLLRERLTQVALKKQQIKFNFFSMGLKNRLNTLHCPPLMKVIKGFQHPLRGIRSCNLAFWRTDAINVNGFNEAFWGWGREDSEFIARLQHTGIKRVNCKFGAIAFHLHHPEQSKRCLAANEQILLQTLHQRKTWCEKGINQYLEPLS